MAESKTGTREWAERNVNIQRGCEHNCRYCYARYMAVTRFKRCTAEEWKEPIINYSKVPKKYSRPPIPDQKPASQNKSALRIAECDAQILPAYKAVMFPSSHDITPRNLYQCITVIENLLEAGHNVLIVSKPHWSCITEICDRFRKFKERTQIMFRFTIGSMDDEILGFWEPGATRFAERFACLRNAYHFGYQTSISCEPYLDSAIANLYLKVKPYLTDSFWIGKLRDFNSRVDLTGVTEEQLDRFVKPLKALQDDRFTQQLYERMDGREFVKFKDSIREIFAR